MPREAFFSELGYALIVTFQRAHRPKHFGRNNLLQMNDAYSHFSVSQRPKKRDTSFWRTASFEEIGVEGAVSQSSDNKCETRMNVCYKMSPLSKHLNH